MKFHYPGSVIFLYSELLDRDLEIGTIAGGLAGESKYAQNCTFVVDPA